MTVTIEQGKKGKYPCSFYWHIGIDKYSTVYKLEINPISENGICLPAVFRGTYSTPQNAKRAMRRFFNREGIE